MNKWQKIGLQQKEKQKNSGQQEGSDRKHLKKMQCRKANFANKKNFCSLQLTGKLIKKLKLQTVTLVNNLQIPSCRLLKNKK